MQVKEAPGLKFGTEAGLDWGFEHDKKERGLEIHLGGEIAYTVPNVGVTPFFGLQIKDRLTESTHEEGKKEIGHDDDGDKQINLWLGADYFIILHIVLNSRSVYCVFVCIVISAFIAVEVVVEVIVEVIVISACCIEAVVIVIVIVVIIIDVVIHKSLSFRRIFKLLVLCTSLGTPI